MNATHDGAIRDADGLGVIARDPSRAKDAPPDRIDGGGGEEARRRAGDHGLYRRDSLRLLCTMLQLMLQSDADALQCCAMLQRSAAIATPRARNQNSPLASSNAASTFLFDRD